jgi:carboxyl-terminal processing protease
VRRRFSGLVLALTAASLAFVAGAGARVVIRAARGEVIAAKPVLSQAEEDDAIGTPSPSEIGSSRDVREGAVLLRSAYLKVKENYYKTIASDTPQAIGAVRNMIAHLDDPYSNVYSPDEAREMAANRRGIFHGIGAILSRDYANPDAAKPAAETDGAASDQHVTGDFVLKVVSPTRGGPADLAGLRPGDVIVSFAVNGEQEKEVKSLAGFYGLLPGDLYDEAQKQRIVDPAVLKAVFKRQDIDLTKYAAIDEAWSALTSPGTRTVKLKVARDGKEDTVELDIECKETVVDPLSFEMADHKTATMAIAYFADGVGARFEHALQSAREQGADKVVIDLRRCPGGSMAEGERILGDLLGAASIARIESSTGEQTAIKTKTEQAKPPLGYNVLVDEGTAGVAEIVAGALRDVGRARLFGERTCGDAYVRTPYKLAPSDDDGGYMVELVTGKLLTPRGQDYAQVGLKPDEIVVQRAGPDSEDLVLRRALEHLTRSGG